MPSDPRKAFLTYKNYLDAFWTAIAVYYLPSRYLHLRLGQSHDVLEALAERVRASLSFIRLKQRDTELDSASLRRILRNAWGTEFLLASTGQLPDEELMGIANNWAVVQAYYACYHAAQALLIARGQPRPEDHATTLHQSAEFWIKTELPPWALGHQSGKFLGFPRDVDDTIHAWSNCGTDNCWDLAAKSLRTTRKEPLDDRFRKERLKKKADRRRVWQDEEKRRLEAGRPPRNQPKFPTPILSSADRARLDRGLSPTTLLDYLCRLRLRSNYKDPTMFTDGPEDASESRSVHRYLCGITSATLLVHELHVGQLIGQHRLAHLVDEWLGILAVRSQELGLAARQDILLHS